MRCWLDLEGGQKRSAFARVTACSPIQISHGWGFSTRKFGNRYRDETFTTGCLRREDDAWEEVYKKPVSSTKPHNISQTKNLLFISINLFCFSVHETADLTLQRLFNESHCAKTEFIGRAHTPNSVGRNVASSLSMDSLTEKQANCPGSPLSA